MRCAAKLMGSEGCGGITVLDDGSQQMTRVSIDVNSSIERCAPSIKQRDLASSSCASDSSLWRKLLHSHNFLHERLTKLYIENSSESQNSLCRNDLQPDAKSESAELNRKARKALRNGGGPSKRAKVALLEETLCSTRDNDKKDVYEQVSLHSDEPRTMKQRNNLSGKRGDKRNSKVPTRTLPSLGSASGENAFFGAFGLKPEINDVTKLVEDLALNELLEDSYECPVMGKEKGTKVENANGTLLRSVRKACSVFSTLRSAQGQISADVDVNANKELISPSSVSILANGENEKGNPCESDISSCYECNFNRVEVPSAPLNFPLCEDSDVLERLTLPPPRDLDSLIQNASKPSHFSRNNSDLRSGKQLLHRTSLPPFPWSHTFNGHFRISSEAAKLLTTRSLCQGRWARIGNIVNSPGSASAGFTNLESLTFDPSLVPSRQNQMILGHESMQIASGSIRHCRCISSLVTASAKPSHVSPAPHCPRLLTAAQTLYDIATQLSTKHDPKGILRWPKKPSQKSMKARKSKSVEKPEETRLTVLPSAEQIKPSKRPKVSTFHGKKASPSTSPSANKTKQLCIAPSATRTPEKISTFRHKARKFMAAD